MPTVTNANSAEFEDTQLGISLSVCIVAVRLSPQERWRWKLLDNNSELNLDEDHGVCDTPEEAKAAAQRAVSKYLIDRAESVMYAAQRVKTNGLDWYE